MKTAPLVSLIALAVPLAVVGLLVAVVPRGAAPGAGEKDPPTTFSAGAGGSRAIFLVLREFLPSVERWTRPPRALPLPDDTSPTSLLVMGPTTALTEAEAAALERWVHSGGQLIIAASRPWPVAAGTPGHPGNAARQDFFARHGLHFGDHRLPLAEHGGDTGSLVLEGSPFAGGGLEALFGGEDRMGAVEQVGTGRIVFVADERAWSNDRLRRSTNSAWLVDTVAGWRNGRLLVDEYHSGHGSASAAPARLFSFLFSPWGFAFLQAGIAGLLFVLRRARRFGPVLESPAERVTEPLERVRGLAAMLEAAGAREFAARAIDQFSSLHARKFRNPHKP